jgi:rfaE bifunctional protein nucleotidyltransferase chain/domain
MRDKIKDRPALLKIIHELKRRGEKIIFTNGCFDLLHVGHVRYLERAKTLGNVLVVGINSDDSIRTIKGPSRPILPQEERAEVLSSLVCVDFVTVFNESTPSELISSLHPDVLVKGGDWTKETTVGREEVERSGGEVVILPLVQGSSTSHIVETILKRYEKIT